jgi:hypothetical protein
MRTIFTVVSFARVPFAETAHYAQQVLSRGWTWSRNVADGYIVHKDFPDTPSALNNAENEIAEIMGDYYIDAEELKQRAEQWRKFVLGAGPAPDFASAEDTSH